MISSIYQAANKVWRKFSQKKINKILEIIFFSIKWLFRYSGLEFIYTKFNPPKNPQTLPTGFIWLIGIYIAFFGVASQRHDNRIDIIENRVNSIFAQLAIPSVGKKALSRIPRVQNMPCPYKPNILSPLSVFISLFRESKYEEVSAQLKETIEDWKDSLDSINLSEAILREAGLRGANFRGANLQRADLRGANLHEADFQDADLRGAYLRGAKLREANLQGANLQGANLWKANLRGADLWGADLRGANLRKANLQLANLWGADLRGADLQGANLPNGEKYKRITTKEAFKLHKKLWGHLKDKKSFNKNDWPKLEKYYAIWPDLRGASCFLCLLYRDCNKCVLKPNCKEDGSAWQDFLNKKESSWDRILGAVSLSEKELG
jgi:hypothetical protein